MQYFPPKIIYNLNEEQTNDIATHFKNKSGSEIVDESHKNYLNDYVQIALHKFGSEDINKSSS